MSERHAPTAELLAVRDGEGTPWAVAHAGSCEACAAELRRLERVRTQLRALPAIPAPAGDRWPRIARLAAIARRRRRTHVFAGLAAAAVLVVLALATIRPGSRAAETAERAALGRAMARSELLEQALRALEPERQVLSGQAARAVAELEAQVADLDAQLAEPGVVGAGPGRLTALWQQRAGLLSALVDVRTRRVARVSL